MRAWFGSWRTWKPLTRVAAVLLGAIALYTAGVLVLIAEHVGQ